MAPMVSVIVPNFNHAPFLAQRLDSVLGQTVGDDIEVLVLDDASTDASRSVLADYAGDSRVSITFNDQNSGSPFKQWNRGLRLATGRYVWIAESDDYADPTLLERLVGLLEERPNIGLAYCQSWSVDETGDVVGSNEAYTHDLSCRWLADHENVGRDECRRWLCIKNTIPNASAVVLRREVLEKTGLADASMRLCGDWDLWARVLLHSDVGFIAEPLNYFRTHSRATRSSTYDNGIYLDEAMRVQHRVVSAVGLDPSTKSVICRNLLDFWLDVTTREPPAVPWKRRLSILRSAARIDRNLAVRMGVRSAVQPLRRVMRRRAG